MDPHVQSEPIGLLLAQVSKLHHARACALLEELGLYRGQPQMLRALWEQEGQTHTELGRHLHVRPSTVTKMLKRMEKTGFVERRHDAEDHRVSRVYLTEAGRSIQDGVQRVWRTLEEETFAELNLEERMLLRRLFLQLRENLMRATGGKPPF
jgi:DNA-binding MarR family transcriptional regulator